MQILERVDRALRAPRSGIILAVFGVLAAIAVSTLVMGSSEIQPALLLAALFAACGVWTATTWRRLWRRGDGSWGKLVFDHGVRRLGPASWLLFAIVFPLGVAYDSQPSFTAVAATAVFFFVFSVFSFPVWLWVGYLWGKTMAAFLGIRRAPGN